MKAQDAYKVMFREYPDFKDCFSIVEVLMGLVFTSFSFEQMEDGWGTIQIIMAVFALVLMICGIFWK